MTLDQFELKEHDGKPILMFIERIGVRDGSDKTKQVVSNL